MQQRLAAHKFTVVLLALLRLEEKRTGRWRADSRWPNGPPVAALNNNAD
jgi:hypothetical protein